MKRSWLVPALAFLVGVAGFGLGILLDDIEGSSSWPGGPEIVAVIAALVTLAAVVALAWRLGPRRWTSVGLAVLLAGAGFGLAWTGLLFMADQGCGYTPSLDVETHLEGTWDNRTAEEGLEAQGLTLRSGPPGAVSAATTIDGDTRFVVYVSEAIDERNQTRGSEGPNSSDRLPRWIRLSASFWSEEDRESSDAARNWTQEQRPALEERFEAFLAGFEDETGWPSTGNLTWNEGMMVC